MAKWLWEQKVLDLKWMWTVARKEKWEEGEEETDGMATDTEEYLGGRIL